MRAFALVAFVALTAHAECHTTPTAEDRGFYDRAVVEAVSETAWSGEIASELARDVIGWRRDAFGDPPFTAAPALTRDELRLYDVLVLSSLEKSATTPAQLSVSDIALRASEHALAAMRQRMALRC